MLWGNLLSYQEPADHTPLGLILLENCQVEPYPGATKPYSFTTLTPKAVGLQAGSRKPGAESLAVDSGSS